MAHSRSYSDQLLSDVKKRFGNDVAKHKINVIRNSGLHRHFRCKSPRTNFYWFDVITWPGGLTIHGDMGTYTFARTYDMIHFMRTAAMSFRYAAEKCQACDSTAPRQEFRKETFSEQIDHDIEMAFENEQLKRVNMLHDLKEEVLSACESWNHPPYMECEAYKLMYESGLWDELPDCKEYTYQFLWNLHAIKWLCDRVKDYRPSIFKRAWEFVKRIPSFVKRIDYAT